MKKLLILPTLAIALVAFAFAGIAGGHANAAGTTLNVQVGGGEPGYAVIEFLPSSMTIITGTTVHYTFPWLEPHSVSMFEGAEEPTDEPAFSTGSGTFPNDIGYLTTDLIFGDPANPPSFDVTFAEAGTYDVFCFIHPLMHSAVRVVDDGSPVQSQVDNQHSLDARGAANYVSALADLKAVAAGITSAGAAVSSKPGGAKQYTFIVGGATQYGDAMQFFPAGGKVNEGDSVVFKNTTFSPHTVTFGEPPHSDPFETPGDKSGQSFSGGNLNSGILAVDPSNPNAPTTFEVTFSKAGTYNYICILHAPQAMVGSVTVASRTAPGAPNTGTGIGDDVNANTGWYLLAGAIALAALVAGTSVAAARRN
jgi:plastocyanin